MKDTNNIGIKGRLNILKDNKIIFSEHNTITADNLEILMRCMANVPNEVAVDTMVLSGDWEDPVEIDITDSVYDNTEKTITFIAVAFEETFVGTLTDTELRCSILGLNLATKTGLSIVKDDSTRIELRWTIKITNC